jgi:integrase/recombinase XerD
MSWERYIKDFAAYLKIEKRLSANSVEAYVRDAHKLADYAQPGKSPEQLTFQDLREFVAGLYDIGLSSKSQARIISGIKQFYKFLILEEITTKDPTELLQMPSQGRKLPEVLTVDEIDALQSTIDLSKQEGHRNKAILETLYSCGLRVSELVNLRFEDLFPEEGFVRVIGKGNKQRLVPLSQSVLNELDLYYDSMRNHISIKSGNESYVFLNRRGAKLTRVMIFTIIKDLANQMGLNKIISPHTFRHSFATHLLEGGANLRAIQEMLGHESITTTEIYTHLDQQFLRSAILSYHPRNITKE